MKGVLLPIRIGHFDILHVVSKKECQNGFWLYIYGDIKATKIVLIQLERGDPSVCFEYRKV